MPGTKIIFDSRESGQTMKQVASINGCIITLYDDGTMIQHAPDHDAPFTLPPDTLGIKPVEIATTDEWGAIIKMSDGSILNIGLDCDWMRAHGYICSEGGHWVIHPNGQLWFYRQVNSRWPRNHKWDVQEHVEGEAIVLKGVKKIVPLGEDMYGCALLMDNGRIMVRHSDFGSELLQPAPWLDDGWVYRDVVAGRSFVYGINQHGQVIMTHMDAKSNRQEFVMWPLPDSNAVAFPVKSHYSTEGPREVVLEDGITVFYTEKPDWRGKKTPFIGLSDHVPYSKHIAGKKGGEWLEHAGVMASMFSPKGRVDKYIPHNLKARNDMKAIVALGSI